MLCVILVAGHGTLLEEEIQASQKYSSLAGVPKALLPTHKGKTILDAWWSAVRSRQLFSDVLLVTNAAKYKHYERWATASEFPIHNIINDGTTTESSRLGACLDLQLALAVNKKQFDSILVVAGEMLFEESKLDMVTVIQQSQKFDNLAVYYELGENESPETRGIVEIEPASGRIKALYEKPIASVTNSKLASVVFYCLNFRTIQTLSEFNILHKESPRSLGHFMSWLIERDTPIYGLKLPTAFKLIGSNVTLEQYELAIEYFSDLASKEVRSITKRVFARVGLMGNPSDGFNGKTIALSIKNFWADVTITESDKLVLCPHPLNDPTEFGSLWDLHAISRREGYLGGLRLVQATCKKFYQYCSDKGIAIGKRNFTLKYDTNIPRQVGLAGSSAIVTATLQCLLSFYELNSNDMPLHTQPQFVLDVETEELFIQAGLQDRVVQTYEGLVYMDFSKELFQQQNYGHYERLDNVELPQFFLAYLRDPSDSGRIHSDVGARWRRGDEQVVKAMKKFSLLTDQAREAIEAKDWETLKLLMSENFNLRRLN
ncbi:DgyrCDS12026 [Dimorphilus gyrociliatus]|uniref:DgyrCDS12026 n=1 Tax=Dimorphilus gyrociliatus TaxID=2664684 RepID=A0A7I8W6A5_9ANNE|nr:DgyrCDS12026 [Dimorphilus gyrociliatus]